MPPPNVAVLSTARPGWNFPKDLAEIGRKAAKKAPRGAGGLEVDVRPAPVRVHTPRPRSGPTGAPPPGLAPRCGSWLCEGHPPAAHVRDRVPLPLHDRGGAL